MMLGYGLQWEAILKARKSGCTQYDLLGIPPNGNPSHFMNGLYTFKTGFGGDVVRFQAAGIIYTTKNNTRFLQILRNLTIFLMFVAIDTAVYNHMRHSAFCFIEKARN